MAASTAARAIMSFRPPLSGCCPGLEGALSSDTGSGGTGSGITRSSDIGSGSAASGSRAETNASTLSGRSEISSERARSSAARLFAGMSAPKLAGSGSSLPSRARSSGGVTPVRP